MLHDKKPYIPPVSPPRIYYEYQFMTPDTCVALLGTFIWCLRPHALRREATTAARCDLLYKPRQPPVTDGRVHGYAEAATRDRWPRPPVLLRQRRARDS